MLARSITLISGKLSAEIFVHLWTSAFTFMTQFCALFLSSSAPRILAGTVCFLPLKSLKVLQVFFPILHVSQVPVKRSVKGKNNYCKSEHFLSYCSLPIVSSRTNEDNVHTKAALVWFRSFEVRMTRTYTCKRRQREMAMKRTEK